MALVPLKSPSGAEMGRVKLKEGMKAETVGNGVRVSERGESTIRT